MHIKLKREASSHDHLSDEFILAPRVLVPTKSSPNMEGNITHFILTVSIAIAKIYFGRPL